MHLIIGLGNPGDKYEHTRHNVGFMFLDWMLKNSHFGTSFSDFKHEGKFKGEISEGSFGGEKTILLKPQTFMNLSGESIQKLVNFYKIDKEDILVIYDDMSMDFGKVRFRETGSAGGHNGIKSLIQYFGKDFKRIKIGVGFDDRYDVSDWVLSKFSEEELEILDNGILEDAALLLEEKLK